MLLPYSGYLINFVFSLTWIDVIHRLIFVRFSGLSRLCSVNNPPSNTRLDGAVGAIHF